jgi:hypothetical protein
MIRNHRVIVYSLVAIVIHALLFVATDVWLRSLREDYGAVTWSIEFYYENASKALAGSIPYRDFVFEYPVLAFPVFLIPRLLASDFATYRLAFVAEMLFWDVVAIGLIARHVERHEGAGHVSARLGWYTVYCASLSPLLVGRFELVPMAIGFVAACWWFSGQNILGGTAAALGTLVKIFPGVVAAPALVWEAAQLWISRARGMVAFLLTLGAGLAFWFALGGWRALESLGYHAERGLEVESLFGGAVFLFGAITRTQVPWIFNYKAYHIAPEWGSRLAVLSFPLQAAALLLVMGRFWRSGMSEGVRYAGAAVLAFIITGKVLSPQYLIWMFPFLAVLGGETGKQARRLFLLACATTAWIYPGPGFGRVLHYQVSAILLLNLRNVLLIGLLGLLLFGPESPQDLQGGRPGTGDRQNRSADQAAA